uniref:Putative secreted protein n=1 Tax=Anopheles marajoara TaxID=58244 RepID=A0A2M4CAA4_9DIPT
MLRLRKASKLGGASSASSSTTFLTVLCAAKATECFSDSERLVRTREGERFKEKLSHARVTIVLWCSRGAEGDLSKKKKSEDSESGTVAPFALHSG